MKQTTFSAWKVFKWNMAIVNSLTLHFTGGKFELAPFAEDMHDPHNTELGSIQRRGRLHFYQRFHADATCCSYGIVLLFHLIFSRIFSIKNETTQV